MEAADSFCIDHLFDLDDMDTREIRAVEDHLEKETAASLKQQTVIQLPSQEEAFELEAPHPNLIPITCLKLQPEPRSEVEIKETVDAMRGFRAGSLGEWTREAKAKEAVIQEQKHGKLVRT